MRGRAATPALLALLSFLVAASGCATVAPEALRPAAAPSTPRAAAPATRRAPSAPPLPLAELREPHAEPELVFARTHTVAQGETLYRIAVNHQVSVEQLSSANGIKDPRSLVVGQELVIPTPPRAAPVASGPAPRAPAASRPSASAPPSRPPATKAPRPEPETKGTLDWPLRGVLYARFGKKGREPHDGIDLAAPVGTLVKTAQEGEVLYAGEQRGYGLIVIVQHSEHLITLYAHNRELRVRTGDKVRRGQGVATVGESGKTSGPQLHFEVRVDGKPVDPLDYLGALPSA